MMYLTVVIAMLLLLSTLFLFVYLIDITVLYSLALTNTIFYGGLVFILIYASYYSTKTNEKKYYKRILLCFLAWLLLSATPLLLNYVLRSDEVYSEYAVIIEQRVYKSRRENRLLFPNKWECNYVDETIFDNFKEGNTIKVNLQKGFLNMPIIVDCEIEPTLYNKGVELLELLLNPEVSWDTLDKAFMYFLESWIKEKNPEALWGMGFVLECKDANNAAYNMYQKAYMAGSKKWRCTRFRVKNFTPKKGNLDKTGDEFM